MTHAWRFMLQNLSQGSNLFSDMPSTTTPVAGVGGGVEIAGFTQWWLSANQNGSAFEGDCLRLDIVKEGSATTLNSVTLLLDAYELAA